MNLPSIPKSFFNGDCFDAYRILGAHPWQGDHGEEGWRFAVWAPGATAVEVCGGFDGWGAGIPLQKADTGVWSGFVSGLCEGELYKYRIHGADGSVVMRADPYAFASEVRPANASRLTKLDFSFDDSAWMERRDKCRNLPMNIYELHAGSWKHKPDSTQPDGSDGWYDYEELARELAIEPGDEVICIKKRILADTTPVIYSIDYLPRALFGNRDYTRIDLSGDIFDVLERECRQQVASNVAHLKASCGDEPIRAAMRLAPGEAMLLLDEICYNRLCHPVMRSLSYYTNFFDFSILRKLL